MKSKIVFTVLTLLLSSTFSIAAQAQSDNLKKPWQWTLDERLASRHDPQLARARVAEARERGHIPMNVSAMQGSSQISSDVADVILGTTHPELLLPSEIFDRMMSMAFADDPNSREAYRDALKPRLMRLGLPVNLWDRLANDARPYLNDVYALRDLHRGWNADLRAERVRLTTQQLQSQECRDRAAAISAGRTEFGELFDRLLYEAAAPDMFVLVHLSIPESRQRQIEEGCR